MRITMGKRGLENQKSEITHNQGGDIHVSSLTPSLSKFSAMAAGTDYGMLYFAITARELCKDSLVEQLKRLCRHACKPHGIILREKDLSKSAYEALVVQVKPILQQYGVPLLLHGHPELATAYMTKVSNTVSWTKEKDGSVALEERLATRAAMQEGIGGLHMPLYAWQHWQHANKSLADKLCQQYILGCSIHSIEEAQLAQSLGAQYVLAGHIFASGCKPGAPARGLSFLEAICQTIEIPVIALGGLRWPDAREEVLRAKGAYGLAVRQSAMEI